MRASPYPPLELHDLEHEVGKVGTDMFIALALANMRIYLVGGLALALIAILAIAMANHAEDRRTLALLRIRGASPRDLWRFVVATLLSPALLGLVLGAFAAVLAGFGLANYVWKLREIRTVVQLLPTHLVLSPLTGGVLVLLVVLLIGVASMFSWYVYRRTAHESVRAASKPSEFERGSSPRTRGLEHLGGERSPSMTTVPRHFSSIPASASRSAGSASEYRMGPEEVHALARHGLADRNRDARSPSWARADAARQRC